MPSIVLSIFKHILTSFLDKLVEIYSFPKKILNKPDIFFFINQAKIITLRNQVLKTVAKVQSQPTCRRPQPVDCCSCTQQCPPDAPDSADRCSSRSCDEAETVAWRRVVCTHQGSRPCAGKASPGQTWCTAPVVGPGRTRQLCPGRTSAVLETHDAFGSVKKTHV